MNKILKIYLSPLEVAMDQTEPMAKRVAAGGNFIIINIALLNLIGLIYLDPVEAATLLLMSLLNVTTLTIYSILNIRRIRREIMAEIKKIDDMIQADIKKIKEKEKDL